ncbi:MAG: hypothetical protein LC635_05600, partial [Pseudonocardiaceae bacterium]|nr:hypothetical protein [Pseudonocardiaceae bacterium]
RRYEVTPVAPGGRPLTIQLSAPDWTTKVLTGAVLAEVGIRPPVLAPEQAWLVELTAIGSIR